MLQIYDRVLNSQSIPTLVALTLLVFGLFIVLGMLEHYRSKIMVDIGNQIDADLSIRVFQATFSHAVWPSMFGNSKQTCLILGIRVLFAILTVRVHPHPGQMRQI